MFNVSGVSNVSSLSRTEDQKRFNSRTRQQLTGGGAWSILRPSHRGPAGIPNFSRSQINVLEFEFWLHPIFAFLQISVLGREFCKRGAWSRFRPLNPGPGAQTLLRKSCTKKVLC